MPQISGIVDDTPVPFTRDEIHHGEGEPYNKKLFWKVSSAEPEI